MDNSQVFKLFDNADNLSGKKIGFGLGDIFKKEEVAVKNATAVIGKYNNAVATKTLLQDKFNKVTANNNLTKYLQSLKGGKATIEGYNTALKATSLSSKAAAVGMQALNVAMNVGIMLAVSAAINMIANISPKSIDKIIQSFYTYIQI